MTSSRRIVLIAALVLATPLLLGGQEPVAGFDVIKVKNGPNVLVDLKTAFQTATPGTVIQLPKGTIDVDEELSLASDHVVVRGKGMDKTILDFAGQVSGGQGILATGDYITFENLAIEDTPGDGIRAEDMRGLTMRGVRVEWTGGSSSDNGAYGVYPVLCEDVLIEKSVVIGASDAGIYVGQSKNIIVRKNTVKDNVAGIEIENSIGADVYKNKAVGNTGGILVFNLPGLTMLGSQTRVYKNLVKNNNIENVGSGIVGDVPPGTGILVVANDEVEIFKNTIKGNITGAVISVSYNVTGTFDDEEYDPFTESVYVYENTYKKNGRDAQGDLGLAASFNFGGIVPDVLIGRDIDPDKLVEGELPMALEHCVQEKKASFGELSLLGGPPGTTTELGAHDCELPKLPKIVIPNAPAPPDETVAALCGTEDAFEVDCPKLSDYRLFVGNDPRQPRGSGIPYDLTTPLFSDYATKYRIAFIPDGEAAAVGNDGVLDFPVGTILAKTFAFPKDLRDPELEESLAETRLYIHRESGWIGLPFIWNLTESEAYLSVIGGGKDVSFTYLDGSTLETNYRIPNKNQCARCHFDGPIGPKVRLLNRDYDYDSGTENQLDHWFAVGALPDAPDPDEARRLPVFDDEADGTLEERARAYLESNCAHCHNPRGASGSTGLLLEHDRPLGIEVGACQVPGDVGPNATGGNEYLIVPGSAEDSILAFRINAVEPNIRMPELARSLVHLEGVELISDWIDSLPGECP